MSVICQCPSCNAKYQLGDQFAGRKIKCPKCSATVEVPEAAAPAAAEPATPATPAAKTAPLVKAAPVAKTAPAVAKAAAVAAEEEDSAAPESVPAPAEDDGLGFLADAPISSKRPGARAAASRSSIHDTPAARGDFPAKSGIGARSSKIAQSSRLKKKKQSLPAWMIPAIATAGLAAIALIGGVVYVATLPKSETASTASDGKKTDKTKTDPNVPTLKFKLDWPESMRDGVTLTINGDPREVPLRGDVEFKLPIGAQYHFVLERKGYKSKDLLRRLTEDDSWTVTVFEPETPPGIADWGQDFDAAKKEAADSHKNVMIVFDSSDAKAFSFASSRFNEAVASMSDFKERASKEYVCVYIDNPVNDEAKKKVKDLAQNQKVTGNFGITAFPTVVVTDPKGRPFGVMDGYTINGVTAFLPLMDKWEEDSKTLFDLLERSKDTSDSELAAKTLDFLELNKLDRFYKGTVKQLTQKLPAGGVREVTEQEGNVWLAKFRQAMANPDTVKKEVAEFDQWKAKRSFKKHADMGAALHALAALILANIGEKDEAKKKCEEGLAFQPKDGRVRGMLSMIQEALAGTGKPGEHVPLPRGSGTGFCIAEGNYIMTNHHVIADAKKIMVHLNGQEEKFPAHVIADNPEGDMAVLKADLPADKNLRPIPFAATEIGIGEDVCAFGWPGMLSENPQSTLTNGLISTVDETHGYLVTNCKIEHGNSGGPLCSVGGCSIVGMVSAKTGTGGQLSESYGLAIPASKLKVFLKAKLPHDVLLKIPRQTDVTGARLSEAVKKIQPSVVYVENYQ